VFIWVNINNLGDIEVSRISDAITAAAKEYDIPRDQIFGLKRIGTKKDIRVCAARWRVIYTLRSMEKPLTYPQIGKVLNLDHTTCINAYKKMKETNGTYFDNQLNNLNKGTIRLHRNRKKKWMLAALKQQFDKGIFIKV